MKNKLYYGDNLVWLRDHDHFPNESVDLIYLDPPFNSNADYNVIFRESSGEESQAQLKAFDDTWKWDSDASGMKELAIHAGSYDSPLWNKSFPRIQIRTIKELLIDGKQFDLPPRISLLKKAAVMKEQGQTEPML